MMDPVALYHFGSFGDAIEVIKCYRKTVEEESKSETEIIIVRKLTEHLTELLRDTAEKFQKAFEETYADLIAEEAERAEHEACRLDVPDLDDVQAVQEYIEQTGRDPRQLRLVK